MTSNVSDAAKNLDQALILRSQLKVSSDATLEVIQPSMAEALFELIQRNKTRLSLFLLWPQQVANIRDTKAFIQEQLIAMQKGTAQIYAIHYQQNYAGLLSFVTINRQEKTAEIGYWLDGVLEGKGIISSALKRLMECYASQDIIQKFIIHCHVHNRKSQAVALRCDFRWDGLRSQVVSGQQIAQNRYVRVFNSNCL